MITNHCKICKYNEIKRARFPICNDCQKKLINPKYYATNCKPLSGICFLCKENKTYKKLDICQSCLAINNELRNKNVRISNIKENSDSENSIDEKENDIKQINFAKMNDFINLNIIKPCQDLYKKTQDKISKTFGNIECNYCYSNFNNSLKYCPICGYNNINIKNIDSVMQDMTNLDKLLNNFEYKKKYSKIKCKVKGCGKVYNVNLNECPQCKASTRKNFGIFYFIDRLKLNLEAINGYSNIIKPSKIDEKKYNGFYISLANYLIAFYRNFPNDLLFVYQEPNLYFSDINPKFIQSVFETSLLNLYNKKKNFSKEIYTEIIMSFKANDKKVIIKK